MPGDKPFYRDEQGRLKVRWGRVWAWESWKISWTEFFMILAIIAMTISYVHDTRICREINADPCEWMYLNEPACYEPNTCVQVDWSDPYGLRKIDFGFNTTLNGT